MTIHLGDVPASSTLYIPFASYDSNGASVTLSGLAVTDIEIYKNGSVTQRASDAGYALLDTDGIDFDGIVGLHGFSINLSDNTDAGFYAVGSFYWVVVSAVTIDTQTINFIAATFRIVAAEAVAGKPKVDVDAIAGAAVSTTVAQIGVNAVQAGGTAWGSGAITAAAIATDAIDADALAANAVTEIAAGVAAPSAATIADAVVDEVIAGTTTLRQMLRGFAAALLGKASGLGTTTAVYRNIADTMPVITATVDADGNRSAVTLDLDDTP